MPVATKVSRLDFLSNFSVCFGHFLTWHAPNLDEMSSFLETFLSFLGTFKLPQNNL